MMTPMKMKTRINHLNITKSIGIILVVFAEAIFTIYAFMFDKIIESGKSILKIYSTRDEFAGAIWIILFTFLLLFYNRNLYHWKKLRFFDALCAMLFAIFTFIGRSFSLYDSWDLIFFSEYQFVVALPVLLGWWILFHHILHLLYDFFTHASTKINKNEVIHPLRRSLRYSFVILLGWIPFIIASLPGNVPHDGMYQLSMWFGYDKMTNHHPWLTTMFFGILMSIGKSVNDNLGIFVIIVVQTILCIFIYGYICMRIEKIGGRIAAYLSLLFFALVPAWGSYSSTVIKDTLFAAVFSLNFIFWIDVFNVNACEGKYKKKISYMCFFATSILVCLIRNDGIYRIIAGMLVFIVFLKSSRKIFSLLLICICGSICVYNFCIFDIAGVEKGSRREMLSVPFQQTARYVRDYSDEVTESEKEAIDRVLGYDTLGERYNGELSDPVKNATKADASSHMKEYFIAWGIMGLKHPGTYIEATLNNTYGYFYPFSNSRVMAAYQHYIKGEPVNKGFEINYISSETFRQNITDYAELWRVFPGISLLSNPGAYTWIVLFLLYVLIKGKKYKELVIMNVPILHIAICILSPVNGLLRYALPLMAITPLLIVWTLHTCKIDK